MTLISMVNEYGFPVIISDRAISRDENYSSVILPSTNKKLNPNVKVVDFNVKTIIIQNVLCVCFAGNVDAIKQTIAEITDYYVHRVASKDSLEVLIETLDHIDDISLLFALGGPGVSGHQISIFPLGKWINNDSRENLNILSCGSGAADWTTHFLENAAYLSEEEITVDFCKQRVLLTCMSFLNRERQSVENLMNGWGGGFDVVYYDKEMFHRFDNVAYAFWVAKVDFPDVIVPISLIHNSYQNNNVIVRHLTADGFQNYLITQFNERFPVLQESPDCFSKDIVTSIRLLENDKSKSDLVVLIWNKNVDAEPFFHTKRADGKFGVQFSDIYIKKLKEALSNSLS